MGVHNTKYRPNVHRVRRSATLGAVVKRDVRLGPKVASSTTPWVHIQWCIVHPRFVGRSCAAAAAGVTRRRRRVANTTAEASSVLLAHAQTSTSMRLQPPGVRFIRGESTRIIPRTQHRTPGWRVYLPTYLLYMRHGQRREDPSTSYPRPSRVESSLRYRGRGSRRRRESSRG